jgi:hypothetical protein
MIGSSQISNCGVEKNWVKGSIYVYFLFHDENSNILYSHSMLKYSSVSELQIVQ